MRILWPFLLLLAATSGCGTVAGTIAGYQITPRWKVIVTNADGKPQADSTVKLTWTAYIGAHRERGEVVQKTDEQGETVFEAVTLRPSIVDAWGGTLKRTIHHPHGSEAIKYSSYVTAYFGEAKTKPAGFDNSLRTNEIVISRLVLPPFTSVPSANRFEPDSIGGIGARDRNR